MSGLAGATKPAGPDRSSWRWALPFTLLLAEYLSLSLLVDFPISGSALGLVSAVRLVVPVVIAAAAAGWLLARNERAHPPQRAPPPPPWRPLPALAFHVVAFGVTAVAALRLFGAGAAVTPSAM
ncbi:MAG TPA: hypothetical protein VLT61_13910, partial [Anaeromyxobacteraceae bacterium]|nr:hypothetical protein [Anaeromyxobacteraceae bacterium]